jgi:cytochrome c
MTGPSLAGIFGRKAGSLPSFHRYSDALKRSGIVWDDQTLDAWLRNSATLVPGNEMSFPGIPNADSRSSLIAYLREASAASMPAGMNMQRGLPDLKNSPPDAHVKSVGYCDDTYTVVTASGQTRKFWEFNLRFKTDSSTKGPRSNEPVLVPQGMAGDRAQVVFSNPDEMATFIQRDCPKG